MVLLCLAEGRSRDHRDHLRKPLHARGRAQPDGRGHPRQRPHRHRDRGPVVVFGRPSDGDRPARQRFAGDRRARRHRGPPKFCACITSIAATNTSSVSSPGSEPPSNGCGVMPETTKDTGTVTIAVPKGRVLKSASGTLCSRGHRSRGAALGRQASGARHRRRQRALSAAQARRRAHLRRVRRGRSRGRRPRCTARARVRSVRAARSRHRALPDGGGRAEGQASSHRRPAPAARRHEVREHRNAALSRRRGGRRRSSTCRGRSSSRRSRAWQT